MSSKLLNYSGRILPAQVPVTALHFSAQDFPKSRAAKAPQGSTEILMVPGVTLDQWKMGPADTHLSVLSCKGDSSEASFIPLGAGAVMSPSRP